GVGDTTSYASPQQVLAESGPSPLSRIIAIAAGYDHSLALSDDGKVWSWGLANEGRLGNNMNSSYISRPTRVLKQDLSNLDSIIAIAAGFNHSIALKNNGTVWAWGDGQYGQIGDDMGTERTTATQVKNTSNSGFINNVIWIASKGKHNLALKSDGSIESWGRNDYGQIGDNTINTAYYPVAVSNLTEVEQNQSISISKNSISSDVYLRITDIKSNSFEITAVALDASLVDNVAFSRPDNTYTITQAGYIVDLSVTVTSSSQAGSTTLNVLITDSYGLTSTTAIDLYVLAPPVITTIDNTSTNEDTAVSPISFTLTDEDTNVDSLNVTASSSDTTLIPDENIDISCSGGYCTATITPGTNQSGSTTILITVSDGSAVVSESFTLTVTPVNDPPSAITNATKIAGSSNHSLALDTDGKIWVWGNNSVGQLGITPLVTQYTPVEMTAIDSVIDIAASANVTDSNHSLAVKSNGTVWAWGYNLYGQLGNNDCCTSSANSVTPVQVLNITGVTKVAAGANHSLALKSDGTVWAWGYNDNGQMGNGTSGAGTDCYSPVQVSGLNTVKAIAAGAYHSLALKQDGTVWSWGVNSNAQLGDNSKTERNTPVQVVGPNGSGYLNDIIAISAGLQHNIALRNDGTIWAWGYNNEGQLGQGSLYMDSQYPVQVVGVSNTGFLTDVIAIASGLNHNLALLNDGTIVSWGVNGEGQLGNNNTANESSPNEVYLENVNNIFVGGDHSFAIESDGTVWSWGKNNYYQLGDNTMTQ
ncbi:regulator of chromosome condensation, rcc1, partial [Candidatus Magnetomorum sp. HK-1]